jgi:hypothetical protein
MRGGKLKHHTCNQSAVRFRQVEVVNVDRQVLFLGSRYDIVPSRFIGFVDHLVSLTKCPRNEVVLLA